MRADPVVSVVLPAFCRPRLLKEAVESVLAQTFPDFELIVADNDPHGSAQTLCAAYTDGRLRYIAAASGRGAAAARNAGLALARGAFIAFLDDDDFWHKDFLEKMVQRMLQLPARVGVLHCALRCLGSDGGERILRPAAGLRGDLRRQILRGEKPGGITALVRKEVLERCGGFDEKLPAAQDWDLWIRVSKEFDFDHIPDVLAAVRDHGARISSYPYHAIAARERILAKYAADFEKDPQAHLIVLKRLGKLNAAISHWKDARRWFCRAVWLRPWEVFKIAAWLVCAYGWPGHGRDHARAGRFWGLSLLLAGVITLYSQCAALVDPFVVNDDACQHIWWLRSWTDPALFPQDLLLEYARSLQHWGVLALYYVTAFVIDPLRLAAWLPLLLMPVAAGAVYRLVWVWTSDAYTALLACVSFAVTPLYVQHMTGGHAHVFGFPLLALFFYFLTVRRLRACAYILLAGAFFFPIIFVLSAGIWLLFWFFRKEGGKVFAGAAAAGAVLLAVKFAGSSSPQIGSVLSRDAISVMPEVTAAGRWVLWPVEPFWMLLPQLAESGLFLFKALYKTFLPSSLKSLFLGTHLLGGVLAALAAWWWYQNRRRVPVWLLISAAAAGIILYILADRLMLHMYAPDRYMAYVIPLASLLFFTIPVGMTLSQWPSRWRSCMQGLVLILVLACVPLVKGAGLTDYGRYQALYTFLSSLSKDVLIAAYPETADGIPLFARRRVLVNKELSVPLFDRYWETVKQRTRDFFEAYYTPDKAEFMAFCRRYGVTHAVVEKKLFASDFLEGRVYFEPFGSWIKSRVKPGQGFFLDSLPAEACVWGEGDFCVVDVSALR